MLHYFNSFRIYFWFLFLQPVPEFQAFFIQILEAFLNGVPNILDTCKLAEARLLETLFDGCTTVDYGSSSSCHDDPKQVDHNLVEQVEEHQPKREEEIPLLMNQCQVHYESFSILIHLNILTLNLSQYIYSYAINERVFWFLEHLPNLWIIE